MNYIETIERIETLTVRALRDPEGGWCWNESFSLPDVERDDYARIDTSRKICNYLRQRGLLSDESKGRVRVDTIPGDPEVIEICDRHTDEPLFALRIHFK